MKFVAGWLLAASVLQGLNLLPSRLGVAAALASMALFGGVHHASAEIEPLIADPSASVRTIGVQPSGLQQPVALEEGAQLDQPAQPKPATSPATNGLITIESDTQSADNLTGVVTALGNVRIVYPSRGMVATSRQAQYFSKEGRLILSGDVDVVQDGGNALRAEQVIYLLDEERAEAIPPTGEQVFSQMVISPSNGKGPTPLTP